MPTIIELHLLSNFITLLFMMIIVKAYTKNRVCCFSIIVSSAMFAIIKFLMDYFNSNMFAQYTVVLFYLITSNIIVFKLNHISKLVTCSVICFIYYLLIYGISSIINLQILKMPMFYLSNYFLLFSMGCNCVVFSLAYAIAVYFENKKHISLTRFCKLRFGYSEYSIVGFLDTGNRLVDNKTGLPVVIVNLAKIQDKLNTNQYLDVLEATNRSGLFCDIRKIQYSTVSGLNVMTIFKPTLFEVESKPIDCYIGVSVKNNINYDALLNLACM